jgi:TRAP-type mannitol/chloroaromatic compound transport system permease small subunit
VRHNPRVRPRRPTPSADQHHIARPAPQEQRGGSFLQALLALSRAIDAVNERIGRFFAWFLLAAVIVSAGNALVRYSLNTSSNAWLEIQWYMFSAAFLLCAAYTLIHNGHVRLDVLFGRWAPRTQAWIDLFGLVFFLLPFTLLITRLSWPMFVESWRIGEISSDPGGLARWPVKLLIPAGFALLSLQGVSELVKRVAFLKGRIGDPLERHEKVR